MGRKKDVAEATTCSRLFLGAFCGDVFFFAPFCFLERTGGKGVESWSVAVGTVEGIEREVNVKVPPPGSLLSNNMQNCLIGQL